MLSASEIGNIDIKNKLKKINKTEILPNFNFRPKLNLIPFTLRIMNDICRNNIKKKNLWYQFITN